MSEEVAVQEVESQEVETQEVESQEIEAVAEEVEQDPWYKKRIDELTKDKHDARRQAERFEQMLNQQEIMLKQLAPQPEQAARLAAPDASQFAGGQYDPRYMDAMMNYTRESAVAEARQVVAQEYEQRVQYQAQQSAQVRLETAEASARVKYADYDSVIERITTDPRLAQNATIREAILGMENGPDIAYQLGRNLDIAYEITNMSPIQAGMKLASIIRQDSKVSSAPKPLKPINGTGGANNAARAYAEMSTAEYIATRNAEDKAKLMARVKR